jgi:hypothetical protein
MTNGAAFAAPFSCVEEALILPPSFMRGVAEGRGESAYLRSKYAQVPTFHRKVGTPSDPMAPGFARIHRPTSPINGGGKRFFDTLTAQYGFPYCAVF